MTFLFYTNIKIYIKSNNSLFLICLGHYLCSITICNLVKLWYYYYILFLPTVIIVTNKKCKLCLNLSLENSQVTNNMRNWMNLNLVNWFYFDKLIIIYILL